MANIVVKERLAKSDSISNEEFIAYMGMLLQLDGLFLNITKEFEEKLGKAGLYRFDIKKNIKEIYTKLKNNPKCDWDNFSLDTLYSFGNDGEVIENFFKRLYGLKKGKTLCFVPDHAVGDMVWVIHEEQPTLCKVNTIEIIVSCREIGEIDNSYYSLEILDKKNKPTGKFIQKGESEVYKSKKLLYENTKG